MSITKIIKGDIFIVPNPATADGGLVQVWATSPDSNNWSDHGHPVLCERFPTLLDPKVFEGLVEGDVAEVLVDGITCRLTLNQLGHRYQSRGNFEAAVAEVVANGDYYRELYADDKADLKYVG